MAEQAHSARVVVRRIQRTVLQIGRLLENEKYNEADLSPDFKQLLANIKPGFEENLIRAFKNEARRYQHVINRDWYIHKMDDVLLSLEGNKIELKKLQFPWIPDFRIISLEVDFKMLCLHINVKLGDLKIEGEYEATNMALLSLLPVSNVGNIEFTFKDVAATGKVGLLIVEDSFIAGNYDIQYEQSESSLSVKYYVNKDNEIENKVQKTKEDILTQAILMQLNSTLTNLLHKQLGEAVVQFSLTELLIDEDLQLREMARAHSARANRLLDSLLCTAKDYLVARNFRSIETPPFNVVYRGKPSGVFQGKLFTGSGYIQDLATLSRLQDLSLFEDGQKLTIYGSLGLKEMKHGYEHFASEFEDTQISGNIKTSVYQNKIFVKLSVHKEAETCTTRLDAVQVTTMKDIDVDASGLGSLSWLVPKIESWVIGNLRYNALPVLEKYIQEAFEYAIAKTHCVSLLH